MKCQRIAFRQLERDMAALIQQRCNAAFWTEAAACGDELGRTEFAQHCREVAAGATARADKLRRKIMEGRAH